MKKINVMFGALTLTTIFSGQVAAAEQENMEVNLSLRTFYMNRDFNQGIPGTIAAGQAFRAEFITPHWNDMLGFNAAVVHVAKLEDDETLNSSDVLTEDAQGYTTLEEAFVSFKPVDDVEIRAGRMIMITPLLNDFTSRISAPSTQAIFAQAQLDQGNFYAFYSNKASMNNSESFTSYTANGENYGIASVGAKYELDNGLSTHLQYATAEDYLTQYFINLAYTTKIAEQDLLLDLVHMQGRDDGDLYGSDYDSNLTALSARLSQDNLAYTVVYQAVGGSDAYNQQWGGSDNTQFFSWGAVQLLDFNDNDEQSLQARIDYKVAGVPGLELMARHTQSWGIDYVGGDDGKRHETDFDVKYTLQTGAAKGLNFRLRAANVGGDEAVVPCINDLRFIINYKTDLI